ncbi:MAG TPA: nucleotidyltransferase family protein [Bacillales bacterium]
MADLEKILINMIENDRQMMKALQCVQELGLPEGCISAGMIRNFIWDAKHGYEQRTPLNDIDVLYYDPYDIREETEKAYERQLRGKAPGLPWSVKNEARMHLRNGDEPYASVEDAMKHWAETATAVAVRLQGRGELIVSAPFGLKDLFGLILRQGPYVADETAFERRCAEKRWLALWPKLRLAGKK